jgi:hypothetical protein
MPMLNNAVKMAVKPLPRRISPQAHATIDYLSVAASLLSAAFFWRRNQRASLAALVGGGTQLALSLLTDYDGDGMKTITLEAHRDIDVGLGAMTAMMPEFLAFDGREKNFFLAHGAVTTAVAELTDTPQVRRKRRRAA